MLIKRDMRVIAGYAIWHESSPASFQRLFNSLIAWMDEIGAYIDDVIIYNDIWLTHLGTIKQFFDRLTEYRLTVN